MKQLLVSALVACTRAEDDREPPPAPPAPGILRGTVNIVGYPGMETETNRTFDATRACEITVTPERGDAIRITTSERGAYEAPVAPGTYRVAFSTCGENCPPVSITIASDQTQVANATCHLYFK